MPVARTSLAPLRAPVIRLSGRWDNMHDIGECIVNAGGNNECGIATRWICTNNEGGAAACADIDECVVDADSNNDVVSARWTYQQRRCRRRRPTSMSAL